MLFLWWPAGVAVAQTAPALSLDEAVAAAIAASRLVEVARLDVSRAGHDRAALETRRRPSFSVSSLTGSLVAPLNLVFPAGSLGSFPTTGPIPSTDHPIKTDPRLSMFLQAQVAQPLTQLRTIRWGTRALQVGERLAEEHVRATEAGVRNDVRKLYYGLLQAESGLPAFAAARALYQELDRLMTEYREREAVLPAEALKARSALARQEQGEQALRSTIATLREQLNHLMGRPIDSLFTVVPVGDLGPVELNLPEAEERAVAARPEVRQARLKIEQAGHDLERGKAEGRPEISLMLTYLGFYNFEVLPRNVAAVGVYGAWEPWDWGRRKAEQAARQLVAEQAQLGLRETEAGVRLDVRQTGRRVADARALLRVVDLEVEAAREGLRVATERFRYDAGLRREVLEAQAALSAAEQQHQQALAEYWSARADFDKATGGTP